MATQPMLGCVTEAREGARLLPCPLDLSRGREGQLLSMALPIIEETDLVLDMSRVRSIDAAGIGLLVFLHQCGDHAGNSLVLVNPSARVREMLALVHLDHVLMNN